MVNILNRKLIHSGSDAEDAARVWSALKAAGIPYSMQTKGVQSRLVGGVHARMGMNLTGGNSRYSDFADGACFTYYIYVRKSDYPRALALIS